MDDKRFFDKVYACWMGKNIGGTLGGPLEGRMELMDIKGYTQSFVEAVENDDLDLQLVNLHCVEQYGGRADVSLLSREWLEHVHFQYDEYGHSLTNMRRGLGSPLSGCFNNFFTDCMGSPIRSEIWAVICAGMPDLAAYYAYHDASVDHAGGEGMYGEIFFAVLESMAFFETDKFKLIDTALSYLPKDSTIRRAVEMLVDCYHKGMDWQTNRQTILDHFGTDNFTYAPVNIAFTLIGWLYEEGFTAQMLTTANCGYDTDCTVATLGSLLGILYGSSYIDSYWTEPLGENIVTSKPITGFAAPATITELTERSIAARKLVQAHYEQANKDSFKIPYQSKVEIHRLPTGSFKDHDLELLITRCPAFAPGETKEVTVTVKNLQAISQTLELIPQVPEFRGNRAALTLAAGETREITLSLTAPQEKKALWQGFIEIRRTYGSVYWHSEYIPLTCLPTMDWIAHRNSATSLVSAIENRITKEMLPNQGGSITLETNLVLTDGGSPCIKFACANPMKVWLDDAILIDCSETTVVIPAYHRAPGCKCAGLPSGSGSYKLRVEIGNPDNFEELYFFVVDTASYDAYRLDSMYRAE